jgi:O-antigen ligase
MASTGYAGVEGRSSVEYLFVTIGACVVLTLIARPRLTYVVLLPFWLVIWLGEGFRWGDRLPVAPQLLCFGLVLAVRLLRGHPLPLLTAVVRNRPLLLFLGLFAAALIHGIASSADPETIKQDAAMFFYFPAMYALVAGTPNLNIRRVLMGISIIAVAAVAKVLYLYQVPVGATWLNDWQASVTVGNSPLDSRVLLRGADVFFFLCAAFPIATVLVRPRLFKRLNTLLLLVPLGVGMYFSSTRSNWIGFGAMILMQVAVLSVRNLAGARTRIGLLMGLVLLVGLAWGMGMDQYSLIHKVTVRFAAQDRETSVQFRTSEAEALVKTVGSSFLLGLGFGSTFRQPMSSSDAQGGWSHNAYLFLYLKMGVIGVLVYLAVLARGFKRCWQICLTCRDPEELSLHLGLFGALVCLCVLSVAVNKNFAVSGALFSGLALGAYHRVPQPPLPERRWRFRPAREGLHGRLPALAGETSVSMPATISRV